MTDERAALARLYDLDLLDDPGDLDLYLALAARTGGPILELGVGTGRLAVALAAAGYEVTGVDNDPAMLARAARRADDHEPPARSRLRLLEADMLDLRLPGDANFAMAFIALNTLLLLGARERQVAAIDALAGSLRPNGLAVVDVWLPDADDLARFDGRVGLEYARRDPESGRLVTKLASARHDPATQAVELSTIYEEGEQGTAAVRWYRRDLLRLVGADELRAFAEDAGLQIEIVAGGYDLEPLDRGADRAVLVAVRR